MAENFLEEQRENWGSRAGFVLAAIGSAVGLGNLWGFPYKLYAYGGGAFLIPYLIAMVVIGVPLLILELSLGHMTQRAAPEAYRMAGRKKEVVGWWGILLGFTIITYYPVILAWCLSFLIRSVEGVIWYGGHLPWAGVGAEAAENASNFFLYDYCNIWKGNEGVQPWSLGSISPEIVFMLVAVWVLMFLCIFRGVRVVSKVVFWTVPLPWLMLLVLAVRGLTLEGATEGLAYYLNPDWNQLLKPTTWRFAFGQVFFSMSLAFGVMITYASFLHRKSDLNNNAAIVGLGDLGTSFVAGIAVFATLGAMSLAVSIPVDKLFAGKEESTAGMAFIAFPYALAQLPYSAWFGLVFFFALITLGIDSAFSITESVLASIVDKTGWNRTATLWGLSFIGLALGLVYCSRGGLAWLGDVDGFINGPWGIALVGLAECLVIGWTYRLSRLRAHANERSDWKLGAWWDWNIRIVAPVILSAVFAWMVYDTVTAFNPESGDTWLMTGEGTVKLPTLLGLIIVCATPAAAVAVSIVRSKLQPAGSLRWKGEPVGPPQRPMIPGAALGGAALLGTVLLAVVAIATKLGINAGRPVAEGLAWGVPQAAVVVVAGAAILAGVAAIVLGSIATVSAEREGQRPHWTGQSAGVFGAFGLGSSSGLSLALYMLLNDISAGGVKHTTELQPAAYIIMAVMLGLLVAGIAFCFYRAIKAAGTTGGEQVSEGAD